MKAEEAAKRAEEKRIAKIRKNFGDGDRAFVRIDFEDDEDRALKAALEASAKEAQEQGITVPDSPGL